jgi:asparagine synthase (glutamine-hydrolysing)
MCGICGAFNFDRNRFVDRVNLEAMNRQIVHRGPDDEGYYLSGNVGLAMRRLSIIDLRSGHQPITNEDRTIWIVFNGEIYNHRELREGLEEKGHRYQSQSDTETIVHLYEEYGLDCVHLLRGMFAFVIWDSQQRRLFAARDRLGIKPFYFLCAPEKFLFASEIKSILACPGVSAELNRSMLPEYLAFGYMAGTETLFAGIQKLLPGETLEVSESGKVKVCQYWDLPQNTEDRAGAEECYVRSYRNLLEETVSCHLMSDVPLGVFLSGGLDSSTVAALVAKVRGETIETFSVGYGEEAYSELRYAQHVAGHIRSNHHEVRVDSQQFFQALPKLIWHEDEPLVWPSSVSLYFVARLAAERVKVVLTGEGADETLGGYGRYAWTMWNTRMDRFYRHLIPAAIRGRIRKEIALSGWVGASARRKLGHTFLGRDSEHWASFYFDNFYCAFSESDEEELLACQDGLTASAAYQHSLCVWQNSEGDLLSRLLYTDIKTYLVELCMKQDQMSMAASIESRVPFLDHRLVEFTRQIPSVYKLSGFAGKRILKKAVGDLLPESIIYRKKMGFPTPLSSWFRGREMETVEKLLLEERATERGLFRPEVVKSLLAEHRSGYRDHVDRIWRLLNFELWARLFLDSTAPTDLNREMRVPASWR